MYEEPIVRAARIISEALIYMTKEIIDAIYKAKNR